jgi:hypothetical protein
MPLSSILKSSDGKFFDVHNPAVISTGEIGVISKPSTKIRLAISTEFIVDLCLKGFVTNALVLGLKPFKGDIGTPMSLHKCKYM